MKANMLGALALSVVPGAVLAQDSEPLVTEEVLITGGLTPIDVEETGRAYTVITGEQLEARGTRYVADALRQVPGVAVSRTGSFGGLTQIRIRGAEGNHVLVLVDGLEIAPAGNGEVDFGSLAVTDIERIEILRGPQSALFGSNAAAGVIQIITKQGRRNTVSIRGQAEAGSDGTALLGFNLSGGGEVWDAAFGAQMRRTDGFNIATGTGDREGERDGDRNITLTGQINWDATPDLSFGANLFFVDRKSETDDQAFPFVFDPVLGFFVPDLADPTFSLVVDSDDVNDAQDLALGIFTQYEMLNDALVHQLNFDYTRNTSDNFSDGVLSFGSQSRRIKAGYLGSFEFNTGDINHVISGLFEYENELNETRGGIDQSRTLFGLGGEYRIAYGPAALQASVRNDFNDEFEDALTFAVSGSYDVDVTGTRFHGSVGRGVTNPDFFQQFGFTPNLFIGNPDLIPERSFQWDIGVEQSLFDDRFIVDVTYFRGKLTNEIVPGFNATAGLSTSENLNGDSPRQGVEVSLTAFPIDSLAITGSYTYTLAEEATGRQEVRRPKHLASLDATYTFLEGRARLNGNVVYNGDQLDNDFSSGFLPAATLPRSNPGSFVLVGIQGSYQVTEAAEIYARIENLTDADYQEVLNYESQGITGFAGIRVNF